MKGVPLNEELYNYIASTFAEEDDILKMVVKDAESKNFPMIQVSPDLGKLLYLLIKIIKAKNILEIGTLAGYSSIWLARALPEEGKLITLEVSNEHAETAKGNFTKAGLNNKIDLISGNAMESLNRLKNEKFDFVFIDADKTGYPHYFDFVISMMNKGGIIAADNALRKGRVILKDSDEGTEAIKIYNKKVAADSRVESLLIPISDGLTVSWVK
ncbi:MAG TPA: O-methyltransferase [Ignavibacteria bacterium]|jgi:predicted O-methyltransferase YrrM